MPRGRTFTREFKLEVVRQVEHGERRPVQVCREHGLADGVLWRWRAVALAAGVCHAWGGRVRAPGTGQPGGAGATHRRVGAVLWPTRPRQRDPKKGAQSGSIAERRAMIPALQATFPQVSLRRLCSLLGISRSGVHAARHGQEPDAAAVALRAVALREAIERIVLAFPGYGYRRVTHALRRDGWIVNPKRVLRIMREEALLCQLERRFLVTTDSRHGFAHYPNLLPKRAVDGPNQAWVADITYIRLPTTFCYLAALLDAWSRRVVGWALSRHIDTDLTLVALERAIISRRPAAGVIHHSDHGVQYVSHRYVARLEQLGAQISMAAIGNVYENALAESFFATLKREEVYLHDYQSFAEAEANLARFLDEVYNHKRLHSSLGYCPPSEFEAHGFAERDDERFLEGMDTLTLALVHA
jgi:putative transposase